MRNVVPAEVASTLTEGERFELARRRAGLTQNQVPGYEGRQREVSEWETGLRDVPLGIRGRGIGHWQRVEPTMPEMCRVLRRRLDLTMGDAARLAGRSRLAVDRYERGAWNPKRYFNVLVNEYRKTAPRGFTPGGGPG